MGPFHVMKAFFAANPPCEHSSVKAWCQVCTPRPIKQVAVDPDPVTAMEIDMVVDIEE